jgi:hypothetical protein
MISIEVHRERYQLSTRGATTYRQVTILPCVPTHPRDEDLDNTSRGFIGAMDGVDVGFRGDVFLQDGAEVGIGVERKGGSSE